MFNKVHIKRNAVIVDALVEMIVLPLGIGYRESGESALNLHLGFNISFVVSLEILPLIEFVSRIITGATAVCDSSLTRLAEITYKLLSRSQFLLLKTENRAYLFKGKRKA